MQTVTLSNYLAVIAKAAKSHGSTRAILQTVATFAIAQCNLINVKTKKVNGDYTVANNLVGSKDFAGLSMKGIQVYIEAHADCKWEKTSDGNKFVSQKTRNYKVPVLSEKTWWEFSATGEPTVSTRLDLLGAFVKRYEGIIKGAGKVTLVKADAKKAEADLVKLKGMLIA